MAQLLQLFGSFFISGAVILIVLTLNFRYNSTLSGFIQTSAGVRSASGTAEILETDIYKAGYRVTGSKILQADSLALKFCGDIDNTTTIDTVYYYCGAVGALPTPNPYDRELFRKINSQSALAIAYVRNIKFTYSDSTGTAIAYGTLSTQAGRNTIEYITCYLRFESSDSTTTGSYNPVEWKKKFRPKNL